MIRESARMINLLMAREIHDASRTQRDRCNAIIKSCVHRARDHPYSTLALQCLEASAEQAQKQEQINATHPLQTELAKATRLSIEVRMLSRNGPGLQVRIQPSGRCIAAVILHLLHFFLPSLAAVSPTSHRSCLEAHEPNLG